MAIVYNEAGEVVRVLFSGLSSASVSDLGFSTNTVVGDLSPLNISMNAILSGGNKPLVWLGDNDNGQAVQNGKYYIKFEFRDTFNKVTAFIRDVTVLNPLGQAKLELFNTAGERVGTVPTDHINERIVDYRIKEGAVSPAWTKDSLGNPLYIPGSGLVVELLDDRGQWHTAEWTGTSDQGAAVASGTYVLQLSSVDSSNRARLVKSNNIQLLNNGTFPLPDKILVGPNPATDKIVVSYPRLGSTIAIATLYNLAGEDVGHLQDLAGSGKITFGVSHLASGIYVVVLEHRSFGGARLSRLIAKVVIAK